MSSVRNFILVFFLQSACVASKSDSACSLLPYPSHSNITVMDSMVRNEPSFKGWYFRNDGTVAILTDDSLVFWNFRAHLPLNPKVNSGQHLRLPSMYQFDSLAFQLRATGITASYYIDKINAVVFTYNENCCSDFENDRYFVLSKWIVNRSNFGKYYRIIEECGELTFVEEL